jgi:Cu/Ag efflux protein CusF
MTSIKTLATITVLSFASMLSSPAHAQPVEPSDGEVRKVDREQNKVTLKHGEIKNLDMPPMTMVFWVKDRTLLDKVKSGDKVRFKAIDDGGKLTITEIEPAK